MFLVYVTSLVIVVKSIKLREDIMRIIKEDGDFFALPFVAFYCGLTNELSIAKLCVLRSLQPAFLGYGWILRKAILKSKVFVVVLINGGLGRMGLLACLKYNFGF